MKNPTASLKDVFEQIQSTTAWKGTKSIDVYTPHLKHQVLASHGVYGTDPTVTLENHIKKNSISSILLSKDFRHIPQSTIIECNHL